jgi:hypothetical protein
LLSSIISELETKELNLFENISYEFIADEYDQADFLFKNEFTRAAGAIAGVAIERHLQTIAKKHNINVIANPPSKSKSDFSDYLASLKRSNIIDETQRKQFDALYQIRKMCDHPDEPKKEDVERLIRDGRLMASSIK